MSELQRPKKRALLVGINSYPNLPIYSQLKGCVNDVLLMRQILETLFGFPPDNIVVLTDLEATGANIRQAMTDLMDQCQRDDLVVFHYSGHGSQMVALGDKPRGYDESIMPSDSGRLHCDFPVEAPPTDIRDTEIEAWLSGLAEKTSHITLIFDSCHSGSITRMVNESDEGTRLRWVPPDPLPAGVSAPENKAARGLKLSGWLSLSSSYVLLAACAAEQGAYELAHEEAGGEVRNGAFTFFLSKELRHANATNTYQDVWERVALNVNNRFRNQNPQLEGAGDRTLFDVQETTPMRYLLVTGREDNQITLAGGAVHGVSLNSHWHIYPLSTKQVPETKDSELGTVEISAVEALTSSGVVISEKSPLAIEPGDRAVETLHVDHETRMSICLKPALPGYEREAIKLRERLEQSELLRVIDSQGAARVLIEMVCEPAGSPPGWAVSDQSGARLMRHCLIATSDAAIRIRHSLETIWRYEKVLELNNPDSSLQGKVDFVILRESSGGGWHEVRPDESCFTDGEKIAFRVLNHTGESIHVSVLDLGLSRRIGLLYPTASASEEVGAAFRSAGNGASQTTTGVLSVGEQKANQIELVFPRDLTLIPSDNGSRMGKEIFKLVVTKRRHDVRFLDQPGLRDRINSAAHPLEKMIYLATGPGLERETRLVTTPEDEWMTIERSFWLRPKS